MKLTTDDAFNKAWKKSCPTCSKEKPNRILWFREQCNDCANNQKTYTEEELMFAYMYGGAKVEENKDTDKLIENFKKLLEMIHSNQKS